MLIVLVTFVLVLGIVLGAYWLFVVRPERGEQSRLLRPAGQTEGHQRSCVKPGDLERRAEQAERCPGDSGDAVARARVVRPDRSG